MKNTKVVAINNGKCKELLYVKTLDEKEVNRLANEKHEYEQEVAKEKQELLDRISELESICERLEHEIKVLKGEE